MSGFFDDLCGDPAVAEAMQLAGEAGNAPSPPPGPARRSRMAGLTRALAWRCWREKLARPSGKPMSPRARHLAAVGGEQFEVLGQKWGLQGREIEVAALPSGWPLSVGRGCVSRSTHHAPADSAPWGRRAECLSRASASSIRRPRSALCRTPRPGHVQR
jgi:hypothetical protein